MNRIFAVATVGLLLAQTPALAQEGGFGPLITPDQLAEQRSALDPLILDIRESFAAGHIAGAVPAPYALFRGPAENPGDVPGEEKLTEVLRGLGVTFDRPTVIVHQGTDETDFGAAARVYWTLKSSGVSNLAIMNGGMNAWLAAGQDASTEAVPPVPSDITVSFDPSWLATRDEVQAVVSGETDAVLIDARPQSFWEGEQSHAAAARPGTLPQSQYFTHSRWFSNDPTTIDAATVRALAAENGYVQGETLVSFCNTGHWAATNWFALSELAGIEDVKLYPESMVGWSNAGGEMANTPGAVRNLWNQIRNTF